MGWLGGGGFGAVILLRDGKEESGGGGRTTRRTHWLLPHSSPGLSKQTKQTPRKKSALRDSRFSPVAARELPALSCGVSLLSRFERAAGGWDDWEVGVHGIIIEFTDPRLKCRRSATFLPEVSAEQGWGRREAVEALVRKAGASFFALFVGVCV